MINHGRCNICNLVHSIGYNCRGKIKNHSKYSSEPSSVDGFIFHSKKEANRYKELLLMKNAGLIENLQLQPLFILQTGFIYKGKKERAITYIADFQYTENGKTIVEDVKGMQTDVYKIKRKLLLYKFPDIHFQEIY